jgi:acyl carrier protein
MTLSAMSVRATIVSQIEQVASEHQKPLAPLTDDLVLLESGLDSLSLAVLVVRLEELFGFDPFNELSEVHYPVTLRDLIRLYEKSGQENLRGSEQAS